jgi:ubiquinone/menaquinone biosynthesis C-methylase UbiE
MSVFDRISCSYDLGMLPLEWLVLRRLRRRLYPYAHGRVLELGVGTGVNLPLYEPVSEIVAVDLSETMLERAQSRRTRARVEYARADVEYLPFVDKAFGQVFTSLLFCSVANPARGLAEIRRVLRSGGWLIMLEHVRGEQRLLQRMTDWLDRPWHRFNGSCHINRDTASTVRESGFRLIYSSRHGLGLFQIIVARSMA